MLPKRGPEDVQSPIDFQTKSVLALSKKTEIEWKISVFYFVPKHFRSENQLHLIRPLEMIAHTHSALVLHKYVVNTKNINTEKESCISCY